MARAIYQSVESQSSRSAYSVNAITAHIARVPQASSRVAMYDESETQDQAQGQSDRLEPAVPLSDTQGHSCVQNTTRTQTDQAQDGVHGSRPPSDEYSDVDHVPSLFEVDRFIIVSVPHANGREMNHIEFVRGNAIADGDLIKRIKEEYNRTRSIWHRFGALRGFSCIRLARVGPAHSK